MYFMFNVYMHVITGTTTPNWLGQKCAHMKRKQKKPSHV